MAEKVGIDELFASIPGVQYSPDLPYSKAHSKIERAIEKSGSTFFGPLALELFRTVTAPGRARAGVPPSLNEITRNALTLAGGGYAAGIKGAPRGALAMGAAGGKKALNQKLIDNIAGGFKGKPFGTAEKSQLKGIIHNMQRAKQDDEARALWKMLTGKDL